MSSNNLHRDGFAQSYGRQSGVALLQVLLVVLVIGAALAAAAVLLHAPKSAQRMVAQEQSLDWADEALQSFVAANARLPCPASVVHGEEDCDSGHAKGWLPLRSLMGASGGGRGTGPVRYMVYRGDTPEADLAAAFNAYSPVMVDGTSRDYEAINGLDFCAMLENAGAGGLTRDAAWTDDETGNAINVAYGLATAGPTPGETGARFDDGNASTSVVMESPARPADSSYDDRVRVRTFRELGRALGCRTTAPDAPDNVAIAAVDSVSAAVTVAETVADLQENNIGNATVALAFVTTAEVLSASAIALSAANLANSISTLALASGQLSAAIAACALPPWVQCGLIPVYTSAVALAIAAIAGSGVAIALNTVAFGLMSASLAETAIAYQMATGDAGSGSELDSERLKELADSVCATVPELDRKIGEATAEIEELEDRISGYQSFLREWETTPDGTIMINYAAYGLDRTDPDDAEAVANLNRTLQARLDLIWDYERARLAIEEREAERDAAQRALNDAEESERNLREDQIPKFCTAGSPGYNPQVCDSMRTAHAQLAADDCPADARVKCIGLLERELADAEDAVNEARQQRIALLPMVNKSPPVALNNYNARHLQPNIPWYCPYSATPTDYTYLCREIFVDSRNGGEFRRIYNWVVRDSLPQDKALEAKRAELTDLVDKRTSTAARCEELRALEHAPPGTPIPGVTRWEGAEEILKAADNNGATGPVIVEDTP